MGDARAWVVRRLAGNYPANPHEWTAPSKTHTDTIIKLIFLRYHFPETDPG